MHYTQFQESLPELLLIYHGLKNISKSKLTVKMEFVTLTTLLRDAIIMTKEIVVMNH